MGVSISENNYWESAYESEEYKHWEFSYPSPEVVALAAAQVPRRNARILDVGCGGGIDAIFLAQCGYRVTGVDISEADLRIAKRRAKKAHVEVNWHRGNVLNLPIADEYIDFVTDRGLFHLIEDNDRTRYASELFRVLKNNGRVMIRGASKESGHDQFNPVTEEANKYFPAPNFKRGLVLPLPLLSVEGLMDGRIVILQKT